jgi:hypothetical protein
MTAASGLNCPLLLVLLLFQGLLVHPLWELLALVELPTMCTSSLGLVRLLLVSLGLLSCLSLVVGAVPETQVVAVVLEAIWQFLPLMFLLGPLR